MSTREEIRVALELGAELGEGLHWDGSREVLWMVDIHGCRLVAWDLVSSAWREWKTPQRIGWAIPCAGSDELLLGLQEGIVRVVPREPLQPKWLAQPFAGHRAMRLNDAKADSTGAVWAGSLNNDDESRSDGALYRLSPSGVLTTHDAGYNVCNGPAIRPDGRLMLHTDSGRRTIYSFDLDESTGRISNRRVWKRFADADGYPDGMCFDADGCVWVAHWGAGRVSRFAADGQLLREVSLPTSNVTNVCFAGARLDRLFVTTAKAGLSPAQTSTQPLAGAVFEVLDPCTAGLAGLPFGG